MADVARVAGVSSSTVSHVLNNTRVVNDQTRDAVLRAITITKYRRNELAASLASSRTMTLGLASSATSNPYFADLVRSVERRARTLGYSLFLGDTREDPDQELRVVQQLVDRRVDGVLLVPSPHATQEVLPFLGGAQIPAVLLDRFADADVDQVASENTNSMQKLTGHLADLGHTRIGAVVGMRGIASTEERLAGHLAVIDQRDLDPDAGLVVEGHSSVHVAERAVLELMRSTERPTALVVANNSMTIGTLRALQSLNLRVPGDVALVCYDDFEWSDLFEPRLTAISQNTFEVGARAAQLLVERLSGLQGPARREQVATFYHHRTSCGCHTASLLSKEVNDQAPRR